MRTSGFRLPKTPQNQAITPALKGQVCPFCIQHLRILLKTKPFVRRPPSFQVSFFVSFLFLCHLLKPATHTRNTSCVLRNPSLQFPARLSPLSLRNTASIANLDPQTSTLATKQTLQYQPQPLSPCESHRESSKPPTLQNKCRTMHLCLLLNSLCISVPLCQNADLFNHAYQIKFEKFVEHLPPTLLGAGFVAKLLNQLPIAQDRNPA